MSSAPLLAVLAATFLCAAEQRERIDGQRDAGSLALVDGRLHFLTDAKVAQPVLPGDVIRFPPPLLSVAPGRVAHRVQLAGGQALTGRLLGLNATTLRVQALGVEQLDIPRGAVVAIWTLSSPLSIGDDETQDEVRLNDGDQLFGRLVDVDATTVRMTGRFGERSLSWSLVRGVRLRREAPVLKETDGAQVRIQLANGPGSGDDVLEGVVGGLGARSLTLLHALLGEVPLPRERLRQIQFLYHGRQLSLESGWHVLGERDAKLAELPGLRANGSELQRRFVLDAVVAEARLMIAVSGLNSADESRTEVIVDGTQVGYLEQHAERVGLEPRRLCVPLPNKLLRVGDNVVLVRRTAPRERDRCAPVGVGELSLELAR